MFRTCASWFLARCSLYCPYRLRLAPCISQVHCLWYETAHEIQRLCFFFSWLTEGRHAIVDVDGVTGKIKAWAKGKEALSVGIREIKQSFLETCKHDHDWLPWCHEKNEVKVLVTSCVQAFVTPGTAACRAPLSLEFSRQAYWSGLPGPSLGDLPNPEMEPGFSCIAGRFLFFFCIWATNKAQ